MASKISRRQALLGVSSALFLPSACSNLGGRAIRTDEATFAHGVASGDPDDTSVVIWTRVSDVDEPLDVDWHVASDEDFSQIVARGSFRTGAFRDFTVKVVAGSLQPGQRYFYRFSVNGVSSAVGQTKTLPVGYLDQLVVAVATCSNFPFGYFNAYEAIANDPNVDVVAHLGDYIYEYGADGYGGETGRRIGRIHEPRHETVTLGDYRQRHAQYKTDPGSQAMHGRHPLIAIWDDHESANNPWMGGAQNHQAEEGEWQVRRAASLKAYYEWMPVRDPRAGVAPQNYWRHYKFGDLASLITLESRHTGRSLQVEAGDLGRFKDASEAREFYRNVVGAPDRNFLSSEMESFLAEELRESVNAGRRWRVIGNQSIMARSVPPPLNDNFFAKLENDLDDAARATLNNLTRLGELSFPGDLDAWDGYPVARERFYDLAQRAGARDLLVISGDSHGYWANALYDAAGTSMGVELGSTGITSPRSLLSFGEEGLKRFDRLMAERNKEIVWAAGQYRGFIRVTLNRDDASADFVAVSNVESRNYDTRIVHSERVLSTDGTLRYA